MSKLLTIQEKDREKIAHLMRDLGMKKQIDVVRAGLLLLEKEALRAQQVERWKKAAMAVAKSSKSVNKEFRKHSRLKST